MGDLGHMPDEKQMQEIGKVDVLLIPVGGVYTVGPEMAGEIVKKLNPAITIPMHYRNDKVTMPISTVEDFIKNKDRVVRLSSSDIEIKAGNLPAHGTIYVLKAAL